MIKTGNESMMINKKKVLVMLLKRLSFSFAKKLEMHFLLTTKKVNKTLLTSIIRDKMIRNIPGGTKLLMQFYL